MNITPVHQCQCQGDEQPGPNGTFWCESHQCRKTPHWKHLCETRPKYRDKWNEGRGMGQAHGGQSVVSAPQRPGPGTELARMLGGCSHFKHAAQMDEWGPDECEAQLELLTVWLREYACKHGQCMSRSAAERMLTSAIERARAAS